MMTERGRLLESPFDPRILLVSTSAMKTRLPRQQSAKRWSAPGGACTRLNVFSVS